MKIKEFIVVGVTAAIVLFINNLPLLAGYFGGKAELTFLGRRVINSQDVYTYVAFIEQAKQGKKLFSNLYTTADQNDRLLRPSYLLIGKTAAATGLSSIAAYHLFRVIFSFVFSLLIYRFIGLFFDKSKIAIFILIMTSSGLGFLLGGLFKDSIDLWVPEAITFMSLSEAPHFILSQILMILFFYFFIKKRYFLSGISIFLLSFEHPFNLFPMILTILAFMLWKRKFFWQVLWIFLFSGLGAAYQALELITNPILKAWSTQNILLSPDPISYFIGFGLIIPLALIGGESYLKEENDSKKLIIVWFAVSLTAPFFRLPFREDLSKELICH